MTTTERKQILAAKLRENLKRRKEQTRARRSGAAISDVAPSQMPPGKDRKADNEEGS